jgi:hypothetical protein
LVSENELLQGGGQVSVSYISGTLSSPEKEDYYKSLRFHLLAKSYEEALRHNSENFEAFNRLITNYLLTRDEKV